MGIGKQAATKLGLLTGEHLIPGRAHRIRKAMHMQRLKRADKHLEQWIKVEHYRLHCAERWPESDYKEAVLAAIHSTLKTLEATSLAPVEQPHCMVCASLQAPAVVLELPSRSQSPTAITRLAA
jgi:hypothetical protein